MCGDEASNNRALGGVSAAKIFTILVIVAFITKKGVNTQE